MTPLPKCPSGALSLIGIVSGVIVLYGMVRATRLDGWTALFLATTVLTSVTAFFFPPTSFGPAHVVGILSLVVLAAAIVALYFFRLLRTLPIETRKATLASLLRNPGRLRLSEHISADGPEVFAHACRLGAEGIVSKRLGSAYRSGPCHAWIKIKNPAAVAAQRDRAAAWNR
jgi:hypothetical protein